TEGRNLGGVAEINASRNTMVLTENYFTCNQVIADIPTLTAIAGFLYQESINENWSSHGQSFITDAFSYWGLGSSAVWQAPGSGLSEWVISSFYGRINYSLASRFLVTLNARYDGSSNFGKNNRWAFFPSGAIAWNMKEEDF